MKSKVCTIQVIFAILLPGVLENAMSKKPMLNILQKRKRR